jgi:hypothetical protein
MGKSNMFTSSECCHGAAFAPIIGKPYEGKLHVRFDEGVVETGNGCPSEAPFNRKGRETDMGNLRTRRHRSTLQTANILDKLPKSMQSKAKSHIHDMYEAESKDEALKAYEHFIDVYEAKFPKAVECLKKDKDALFTFYEFPSSHWIHIRTINPIESTFATVRLRTRRTKGCGSRTATMTMVFKLAKEAQKRWKRLKGYKIIPLVLQEKIFIDGELKEDTCQGDQHVEAAAL